MEPQELPSGFISPAGDNASAERSFRDDAGESLGTGVGGGAVFRWIAKCGTVLAAKERL
jgi:acyl-CoA hydrolase